MNGNDETGCSKPLIYYHLLSMFGIAVDRKGHVQYQPPKLLHAARRTTSQASVKYRLVYLCLCGTTIEIGFDRYLYYRVYGQFQSVPVSARSSKTEEIACSKNSLRWNVQEWIFFGYHSSRLLHASMHIVLQNKMFACISTSTVHGTWPVL